MKELQKIQEELKAPKGRFNNFGKYAYRSCEDILEAVKPILAKYHCVVTLTDEIVFLGDRFYVKATASITNADNECVSCAGFARESDDKKGMDEAQITGSASSYARKYALNGLFAIDDNKDADETNIDGNIGNVIESIKSVKSRKELVDVWNRNKAYQSNSAVMEALKGMSTKYPS